MDQFRERKYLNLETYRKNGEGMRTPLWFVEKGDVFYAQTTSGTGKVKRVRRQPNVRLVPCDRRGGPEGEWVAGEAWIVRGAEKERHIDRMLNQKYGVARRLIGTAQRLSKAEPVIIGMRVRE
ncbi:MAG: PPOX class F420-dependent oxidoreductase [Rubrobacteraceae bacterium]